MAVFGKIIKPILKLGSKVGQKIWGVTKSVGSFIGKGISKGFKAVKSGFGKVAGLLGVGSTLLNRSKQNEKDSDNSIRSIESAADAAAKSSGATKAETNKLKKKNGGGKPKADPDALQDKRAAEAERIAANEKGERIKADVRKMDELTGRAARILRKYGAHAASKMASEMTTYKPSQAMMAGKAPDNVLLGEQIRMMYDQKINHNKNIYNILGMLGANNDLLGVLTEQAQLIHRQGLTDANYNAMKAEVMGKLAERAISESTSANQTLNGNETLENIMAELVATQKQGNETQDKVVGNVMKKTGVGIIGGLAGLAGLILASKVGTPTLDKSDDKYGDAAGVRTGTEDESSLRMDTDADDGRQTSDEDDYEGDLTDEERLDTVKSEGIANTAIGTAARGYEAIKRLKSARQVASGAKTATAAAGAAGKIVGNEARKKFIRSLGPRAIKVIGAKIGAKLALKAATKCALKKIPVLGLGFSLFEAIPRLFKGDYTGAALALGSGAASCLHLADAFTGPGGSIAAIGLGALADGALAMHDYNRALEDLKTKGHTDLIDDDDLTDILVTPTEEEMKQAEEAEKNVQAEQAAKEKLANGEHAGDPSMSPDSVDAASQGGNVSASNAPADAKQAAASIKSLGNGGSAKASGDSDDGALMKGLKAAGSFLWDMSPFGGIQQAVDMLSRPSGRTEVSHGTSDNWAGFGANTQSATEGDIGTMNVSPEALDRIQNFNNYDVNELDEGGKYSDDTRRMVNDVTSMQGKIVYSQEQRDIDQKTGDCSAFARWALKKYYGIDIGGYSEAQLLENEGRIVDYSGIDTSGTKKGRKPNLAALKPGDLIFYSSRQWKGRRAFGTGHVEVYIGNGKTVGMNTYKDHVQMKNRDGKPVGPWIHDIDDPWLGDYIAAKRYVGQTESSIDYAVEGSSAPGMSASQAGNVKADTKAVTAKSSPTDASAWVASENHVLQAPTVVATPPPSSASRGTGSSATTGGKSGGAAPNGGGLVNVDNSTTRGGDYIINNNTTTNIYNYSDDRGSAETR